MNPNTYPELDTLSAKSNNWGFLNNAHFFNNASGCQFYKFTSDIIYQCPFYFTSKFTSYHKPSHIVQVTFIASMVIYFKRLCSLR